LKRFAGILIALLFLLPARTPLGAQAPGAPSPAWDLVGRAGDSISTDTHGQVRLSIEIRGRYENRDGVTFGKDPDKATALVRARLGLSYQPVSWLKLSGMVQDCRAPLYGPNAPSTVRDGADLQEGYLELFPERERGLGMTAGRAMLNYGAGRLIGTPQWGNLSRTYDHARVYYRWPRARVDLLLVSPVKIRPGEFNRPELGDRVWGVYNSFPNLFRQSLVEVYVLRHSQNRPGGFTGGSRASGSDRLEINTAGFRMAGPLAGAVKYNLEGALQNGKVGPADHRAGAWVSGLARRWAVMGKPFDLSGEYRFASGTRNPQDLSRAGAFDQLYGAFHDTFGHQDLLGWRNTHNVRVLGTAGVSKRLAVNLMYLNYWLAAARDAVYNLAGKTIVRSATGAAGRHVGQEADIFAVYKYQHFQFGAGYGHFLKGGFIEKTTPGVNPAYAYFFHTYSF
jgi:hypothetical protein